MSARHNRDDDWLDRYFPEVGPACLCGVPGAQQRHRTLDTIVGRLTAGEGVESVADDYDLPVWVVKRVGAEWRT